MKYAKQWVHVALLEVLILFLFSAVSAGDIWAEQTPKSLVIGYQAVPNPQTVVKQMGWHEKALGVPVEWIKYDSGRHVNEALAEGSIDIGLVGTSPAAAAISEGIPIEVIWIHDIIGDSEALAVRKASGIDKITDLAGKVVAAPFGSTTHYHLMLSLRLANIKSGELKIINLEPPEMPAAWKRGDIDGAFVWEPTLSKLLEQDGRVLFSSRQLVERGFPTADLCVVRKEFATKYPSVVITYLKNLDRAVRLYRSRPEEAAAAVAKQLGLSTEQAARQMKGLIFATGEEQLSGKYVGDMQLHFGLYTLLKDTADFLEEAKQIESSPPWPVFMRAVSASYVQKIVPHKKGLAAPRLQTE